MKQEWQPIETAPKNGSYLVFIPAEEYQFHVCYAHPNVIIIGGHFAFDMEPPTHWMPLPDPPKE